MTITEVSSVNLTITYHYSLDENVHDLVLENKEVTDEAAKATAQAKKDAAELKTTLLRMHFKNLLLSQWSNCSRHEGSCQCCNTAF